MHRLQREGIERLKVEHFKSQNAFEGWAAAELQSLADSLVAEAHWAVQEAAHDLRKTPHLPGCVEVHSEPNSKGRFCFAALCSSKLRA